MTDCLLTVSGRRGEDGAGLGPTFPAHPQVPVSTGWGVTFPWLPGS